ALPRLRPHACRTSIVYRHRPAGELGGWRVPSLTAPRCLHPRRISLLSAERGTAMLLHDKVAVIYGAGGAIGGAVARAFAAEGAKVFVTGRLQAPVEVVAKDIAASGGSAAAAEVDPP